MVNENYLKGESYGRRFADKFSSIFTLSGAETVYVMVLLGLFLFFSTIESPVTDYVTSTPFPTIVIHYGFPFETMQRIFSVRPGEMSFHGYLVPMTITTLASVQLIWFGLAMDLLFYALLSLVIVKVIGKLREEMEYRRYDKTSREERL